jgi:hypothetical protein
MKGDTVVKLVILKKEIMKAKGCFQSTNPFISLELKHTAAARVAGKMKMDQQEEWTFNTRGEEKERWISVFLIMTKEFPGFFLNQFRMENLDRREAKLFLQSADMPYECYIHTIGVFGGFLHGKETGPSGAVVLDMETLLTVRKFANFTAMIACEEHKIKKINSNFFSAWVVRLACDKYLACLVCGGCGKEPVHNRCSRCESVRYCDEACQKVDYEEHSKVCGGMAEKKAAEEREAEERAERLLKEFGLTKKVFTFKQYNHKWEEVVHSSVKKEIKVAVQSQADEVD